MRFIFVILRFLRCVLQFCISIPFSTRMHLIRVTISWPLCANVTSSVKHIHRNDNEEHREIGRVVFATLRRYTYKITTHTVCIPFCLLPKPAIFPRDTLSEFR